MRLLRRPGLPTADNDNPTLALIAGSAGSALSMVTMIQVIWKAIRTQDPHPYRRFSLAPSVVGNEIYSVYVFALPAGPMWVLHLSNYAVIIMLNLYIRYR